MANRQYVGARYVPKFADPVEWNSALSYEGLTIVTHLGNSFTSKKPVPGGVDIGNTEYWVNTGNFNAQLESVSNTVTSLSEEVARIANRAIYANNPGNGLAPIVADGVTDDTTALTKIIEYAEANFLDVILPQGTIKITGQVNIKACKIKGAGCFSQDYAGIEEFTGTTIFCATQQACLKVSSGSAGLAISDMHFNGNIAKNGLVVGGAQYSCFHDLSFTEFTDVQMSVKTENSIVGWCDFKRLWFYPSDAKCLELGVNTNYAKNSNVCHNIFEHLAVNHKATGIEIGDADNNLFIGCYIFGTSTAEGVHFINTNGVAPIANIFLHCEAMQGVVFDDNCNYNSIYGYQYDNGEKGPTYNNSTNFTADMYGILSGVRGIGMLKAPSPLCGRVTLPANTQSLHVTFAYDVPGNYFVFTSVNGGLNVNIIVNTANYTKSGFDIYAPTAAASDATIDYMIIGT